MERRFCSFLVMNVTKHTNENNKHLIELDISAIEKYVIIIIIIKIKTIISVSTVTNSDILCTI